MDMDGTITKFNLDYLDARRRALQELDKLNLRTPEMSEQSSIYLILKMLKDKLDPFSFVILRRKFYNLLEEMELKAAQEVTLYPGALGTLRELRKRSVKIVIVTNNGRAGTDVTLKRLNLEEFFDAVVTRDDCEGMKPDPEPVRNALERIGISSEDAILVGDGVMDVMAARAAGLQSVAVATGPFTKERLLQVEPNYLLGSINDLTTLVDLLLASSQQ